MTHELRRREDRFTIERKLKYTCGWTSKELTWHSESEERQWREEHDPVCSLREFMARHLKIESTLQKMPEEKLESYLKAVCQKTTMTPNIDGFLHNGDAIRLKWVHKSNPVYLAALPAEVDNSGKFVTPCRVTGSEDGRILLRSVLHVYRNDVRISNEVPLMYGECIFLSTTKPTGNMFLVSEPKTLDRFSILSGNQEVFWTQYPSPRALWKALPEKKTNRTQKFIEVNTSVILNHVVTNQNLALEENFKINTILGIECEVTANSHDPIKGVINILHFEAPFDEFVYGTSSKQHNGCSDHMEKSRVCIPGNGEQGSSQSDSYSFHNDVELGDRVWINEPKPYDEVHFPKNSDQKSNKAESLSTGEEFNNRAGLNHDRLQNHVCINENGEHEPNKSEYNDFTVERKSGKQAYFSGSSGCELKESGIDNDSKQLKDHLILNADWVHPQRGSKHNYSLESDFLAADIRRKFEHLLCT